jgi:hypothetical protein
MLTIGISSLRRHFSSKAVLDWASGTEAIAKRLFQVHTVEVDDGPRADPRGMRPFELKKKLTAISDFKGDLSETNKYHPGIIESWKKLYDKYMNGDIKLPGRDPAGPLTFHHEADPDNVKIVYDKHGRVQH